MSSYTINEPIVYEDRETHVEKKYMPVKQGPSTPADAEALVKDALGFTNPYLHRRIDPQPPSNPEEYASREYMLSIANLQSYRTTKINTHDEESVTSEIP